MDFVRSKLFNETGKHCLPWFYPKSNESLYEICDPWATWKFQQQLKIVPNEVTGCKSCLRDCSSTKYKVSVSSAPFRKCDQKNIGVSPICDFTESEPKWMMMNPSIWKDEVINEYEKLNRISVRNFVTIHH